MLRHLDAISDYLGTILGHLEPMLSPLGSIMGSAWRNGGGGFLTVGKDPPLQPIRTDRDGLNESNEGYDRSLTYPFEIN